MNERGQYGHGGGRDSYGTVVSSPRSASWVGLKLVHTPGDSERAVRQIDIEINAIIDAMYRAMGVDPSNLRGPKTLTTREWLDYIKNAPRSEIEAWKDRVLAAKDKAVQSPLWSFWESAISPVYQDWQHFVQQEDYYRLFTTWEEYERWLERVRQLRKLVESKGVKVDTSEPQDLGKTLPGEAVEALGRGAKKAGETALDLVNTLKWVAIGAVGVTAVVVLSSVASNLRSGRDPAEKYVELIKHRRRSRELPRASQLALPPGDVVEGA